MWAWPILLNLKFWCCIKLCVLTGLLGTAATAVWCQRTPRCWKPVFSWNEWDGVVGGQGEVVR